MKVKQFVMAYGVDHDRLCAILPEGFRSLRPVLRINAEIRDGGAGAVEFNTAAEAGGIKGWLNIGLWDQVPAAESGKTTVFETPFLKLSFTRTGIAGGCPAEQDDGGCFFPGKTPAVRPPEKITAGKEFCDCSFAWRFSGGAHGCSVGKTLPAVPAEVRIRYPRQAFTAEHAAAIPCVQVLGAYVVQFTR